MDFKFLKAFKNLKRRKIRLKHKDNVIPDDISQVNKSARFNRHKKLLELYEKHKLSTLWASLKYRLNNFKKVSAQKSYLIPEETQAAQGFSKIYIKKISIFIVIFLVLGSLNMGQAYSDFYFNPGFEEEIQIDRLGFVTDEEGYLIKASPSSASGGVYLNRNEQTIEHEVQQGQSLSVIAQMYGLDMQTIMWANNMWNPNMLKIGQVLTIPRVDGVFYSVEPGDTVDKIATKYKVDSDQIRKENKIEGDLIALNQVLLLPGAEPFYPPKKPEDPTPVNPKNTAIASISSKGTGGSASVSGSKPANKEDSGDGSLLWPTSGRVTQGYHRYHLAIDIANKSGTPIYSAEAGTVTRADASGWNGGYGQVIVIKHANGKQTLYAHFSKLYVKEGQKVEKGEAIGLMGSTGRSTGPHVHFEVILNGVKQNPWNYF